MTRRQMKKQYREKWGELHHYRLPVGHGRHEEIIAWLTSAGLVEVKDYFTDFHRRRWYFREKKWAMSIKLIYG